MLEASNVTWEKDQSYEVDVPHKITRKEAERSLYPIIQQLRELETPDDSEPPEGSIWKAVATWATSHPNSSLIKPLVMLRAVFDDYETRGVDPVFHRKLDELAKMQKEMAAAQAAANEQIKKDLKKAWDKLTETCGLMTRDVSVSNKADSLADFSGDPEDPFGKRWELYRAP